MDKDSKKEALEKRKKKHLYMFIHAKKHKESAESMHQAKGGYTDDISMDDELETLKTSFKDKTQDMRSRLRSRKAKAQAMWRGR